PLEPQPRAVFRAGRDRDREPLLDPHLARPVAGGTRLRRDAPPAPAYGARPRDGEPALAERNGAAAFTFGTGRESGARRAARPAARPTAAPRSRERPVAAQLVVLLTFFGIAQHVVCFVDLLEALRRLWLVGVAVGMVLLGEPAKRLLDLVRGRRLRNTQDLIVVLLAGHL